MFSNLERKKKIYVKKNKILKKGLRSNLAMKKKAKGP